MNGVAKVRRVVAVGLVLVGAALPAAAQDLPQADLSLGYQGFDASSESNLSGTQGWYGDGAYHLGSSLMSVVAGVGGSYATREAGFTNGITVIPDEGSVKVYHFLGGVRASTKPMGRATLFGQVLAGAVHASGPFSTSSTGGHSPQGTTSSENPPAAGTSTETSSATDLGLQLGVGANLTLIPSLGARVGLDMLRVYQGDAVDGSSLGAANALRFSVGFVVPIGRR